MIRSFTRKGRLTAERRLLPVAAVIGFASLFLVGCNEADMPGVSPSPAPLPAQSGPTTHEKIATSADGPDEDLFAQVKQRLGVDECKQIYSEMRFRYITAAKQAWEGQTDGNIIMMRKHDLEEEAAADLSRKFSITRRELDALYYHYFKNDDR